MSNILDGREIVKTVTFETEYLGRRTRVTENRYEKNRLGLREVIFEHIDEADPANGGWAAGTVTRKVIRGDGRKPNFETLEAEHLI